MDKIMLERKFNLAFIALTELVDSWDNDTQELFTEFLAKGGSWNVPSLDEVQAEFGQFILFLEGSSNA